MNDFLEELGVPSGASMDEVEKRFLELVKERIQKVAESYDEKVVEEEEKALQGLEQRFFAYTMQWALQEKERATAKNHPDAPKIKAEARDVVQGLQENILAFSLCYIRINRLTTLLRDEIKREEIKIAISSSKGVKWTADAGTMINRNRKEKKQILADSLRLKGARDIMARVAADLDTIRTAVVTLFGQDREEAQMRRIVASLRMADFQRARKVQKEMLAEKGRFSLDPRAGAQAREILQDKLGKLIEFTAQNAAVLAGPENKLVLRPEELDIILKSNAQQLFKIKVFLAKYHLPYMQYKVDSLAHLRDKLLIISSLEALLTLYRRLVTGLALPLADMREVRQFENDVLGRIKWLLQGQFQEIPVIMKRAQDVVAEFNDGRKDFTEMAEMQIEGVDSAQTEEREMEESPSDDIFEEDEEDTFSSSITQNI